jgi:Domain of unknown function (DUF4926)
MSQGSPRPSSPEREVLPASSPPRIFDVVRVRRPVPEHGIRVGDEGTVVEVLTQPPGYLVDFSYEPGFDAHELPVYGLDGEQLEVVRRARRGQGRNPA